MNIIKLNLDNEIPAIKPAENTDFIKLCLNSDLASEITLQPIKRFGFDGAVIFSDILILPYGLGQKVQFEKRTKILLIIKITINFPFLQTKLL